MTALGLLFQPGNPASDPSFLFLLIQIQLACFFWNTFDPDIEKRGKFERAEPDCGLSPDFVATWQQILGGGVDALPSCLEQVGDIVVSNIGQSQSKVTDLADDSCGKMAAQKVVRGAGMGDWQGVSSHALGTVTVNQVHNIVVPR